jgi:hypothetical protein
MNTFIKFYTDLLYLFERKEREITWFCFGAGSVIMFLLILNAQWAVAAVYAGLTALNYYINQQK